MKLIKSDWSILREAEQAGLAVSMTGVVERIRTPENDAFSDYFRKQMTGYVGSFGEDDAEVILENINEYLSEHHPDKHKIGFPIGSGSEIYLIPVTENLQLKLLVVDEYYGDSNYEKYVDASFFVINNETTTKDVDELIAFVKEYLHM